MSEVALKISAKDAEKIAEYIRNIAGNITAGDIAEIVFMEPDKKAKNEPVVSSVEIAKWFCQPHAKVFGRISKYIGGYAKELEKAEFRLTTFRNSQEKEFPMYELTRRGCEIYCKQVEGQSKYQNIAGGIEKFRNEIGRRFGLEGCNPADSNFLLKGKSKLEYQDICNMFDKFITGPALEGREIIELTQKYEQFYQVMSQVKVPSKDSNKLEDALFGVAVEAEMQGFIYGFKLFDALLNNQLSVA